MLKDIYNGLPDSNQIAEHFKTLLAKLTPLSRPDEDIKEQHIKDIEKSVRRDVCRSVRSERTLDDKRRL